MVVPMSEKASNGSMKGDNDPDGRYKNYTTIWLPGLSDEAYDLIKITRADMRDSFNRFRHRSTVGLHKPIPEGNILDLGCGDGLFISELLNPEYYTSSISNSDEKMENPFSFAKRYLGVDDSQRRINLARKNKSTLAELIRKEKISSSSGDSSDSPDQRPSGASITQYRNIRDLVSKAQFATPLDILKLPQEDRFADDLYSMVYMGNVLHWMDSKERICLITKVYALLQEYGVAIATTNAPDTLNPFSRTAWDVIQNQGEASIDNPGGYAPNSMNEHPLDPIPLSVLDAEFYTMFGTDGLLDSVTETRRHVFPNHRMLTESIRHNTQEAYIKPLVMPDDPVAIFDDIVNEYLRNKRDEQVQWVQRTNYVCFQKLPMKNGGLNVIKYLRRLTGR